MTEPRPIVTKQTKTLASITEEVEIGWLVSPAEFDLPEEEEVLDELEDEPEPDAEPEAFPDAEADTELALAEAEDKTVPQDEALLAEASEAEPLKEHALLALFWDS